MSQPPITRIRRAMRPQVEALLAGLAEVFENPRLEDKTLCPAMRATMARNLIRNSPLPLRLKLDKTVGRLQDFVLVSRVAEMLKRPDKWWPHPAEADNKPGGAELFEALSDRRISICPGVDSGWCASAPVEGREGRERTVRTWKPTLAEAVDALVKILDK